ncbi:DUF397 domain-containing protein [Streptomyces fuscigenes]|uniref:DUF397 domain-containing protein n=1 Tax=Streptomyces fuscigenes TaxID=1528880 RepID=UPI001F1AFAAE|nr:DUF397 domain-containing protein [Streptomyces fuscigenes]MCF3962452.1 DUF397 domain-containing protein [Streptomyces fuscigenes]
MTLANSLTNVVLRTSSFSSSSNGGNCVEVGAGCPGVVPVRDSKRPGGPVVIVAPGAWARFVRQF